MNCWFHRCRLEQSPDQYVGLQVKYLIILRSIQFSTKIREDLLDIPMICDLQVQPGRLWLDFNLLLQFPATPWTVKHGALGIVLLQFPATPLMHNMIMSTLLQFTATPSIMRDMITNTMLQFPAIPLRLVVSFPHLRARFCFLDSVLDHVLPAISRGSFDTVLPAVSPSSFNRSWIHLRILVGFGNIQTTRRGIAICSTLLKSNTHELSLRLW